MLKTDSTVRGIEYSDPVIEDVKDLDGNLVWLTFDLDNNITNNTLGNVSSLNFHMITSKNKQPTAYMYFGDSMIPCLDKFIGGFYKDTVDLTLDRGLRRLARGEGIRVDTDRGPTEKIPPKQVESLQRVLMAYEALSLLGNKYNQHK